MYGKPRGKPNGVQPPTVMVAKPKDLVKVFVKVAVNVVVSWTVRPRQERN